jgi:hypothetical protein
MKGDLGKGKGRVGEVGMDGGGDDVGDGDGVGGGGEERIKERDALVCMERAAETLGAKLR